MPATHTYPKKRRWRTSNPLTNGAMVSGSSGVTAPMSFQFFVRPSLIEFACSGVERLNSTASELPSCGQSVVVALSRYMPRSSDQKTSLNFVFNAVAFVAQASPRLVSLMKFARSTLFVKTLAQRERFQPRFEGSIMVGQADLIQQSVAWCTDTAAT